ncbi:MAG: glutamate synthase subunit beta [Proteobacteria bacterium]|nr:glutamate synthase subunit beta [Pseudomonadota bacterium]
MGKETGFLDIERKDPGYRAKDERIKDYRAVENMPDEDDIYDQAARCMDCGIPFCHDYGCPLVNIIPEFNDRVYHGDWQGALDILLATSSFPEFTGRVCPAPCEEACVDGINGEPVTIRQIELAIIEKAFEKGLMKPEPPPFYHAQKVAVIGSGPAGLAAALMINRAGYKVTVYDEADKPGGLLRYGIPDFKMEKNVVERRIRLMEQEGIAFEQNVLVGTDISTRYLTMHFDAICLTCGARKPRDLDIPGRNLIGIFFAMDFLTQQNKRISKEMISPSTEISAAGKNVVVIGGGDTGSDCIGTSLRQGAKNVTQLEILPKPPAQRADQTPWPMWPNKLRESHAHKEGGSRRWSVSTKAFLGENGVLKKIRCVELEWSQKDGRMVPQEIKGSEFDIETDMVLLAMGFTGPGNESLVNSFGLETDARGNIKVDESMMTNIQGVFAGGDMARGQSLVVTAIYSGKQAAKGLINYLS